MNRSALEPVKKYIRTVSDCCLHQFVVVNNMRCRDLTAALEALHTSAPSHSFSFTQHAVETAFKEPLSVMFDWFEEHPVASGSIAQIHRATLSKRGAHNSNFLSGTLVAVKVSCLSC